MVNRQALLGMILGAYLAMPTPSRCQESRLGELLDWEKIEMATFIKSGFYPTDTVRFWSLRGERANRDIKDALKDLFGSSASVESSSGTINGMPFKDYRIVKTNYFMVKGEPNMSSYAHLSGSHEFNAEDRKEIDDFLESSANKTGDILKFIPARFSKPKASEKFKSDLREYVGERGIIESKPDDSSSDETPYLKIYRR